MEYALVFILTVLTIIFWSGKGSWLIAGYNTMDDKEKQNRGRCEIAFKKICFLYCVDGNGCYNRQYCFREKRFWKEHRGSVGTASHNGKHGRGKRGGTDRIFPY